MTLAEAVVEDAQGSVSARVDIVEGADNCRSGESAGELKADPSGFQVNLLDVFAHRPGHLWQQRAQGPQPLTPSGFTRLSADQQTQVGSQAAINRIAEGQREGSGGSHPRRNASLKLNLLSKECRSGGQGDTSTDEPVGPPQVHQNMSNETDHDHSLSIHSARAGVAVVPTERRALSRYAAFRAASNSTSALAAAVEEA